MVSDKAFIFHIYIPWGKTLSLAPKSRSPVKSMSNIKDTVFGKKKSGDCREKLDRAYIQANLALHSLQTDKPMVARVKVTLRR